MMYLLLNCETYVLTMKSEFSVSTGTHVELGKKITSKYFVKDRSIHSHELPSCWNTQERDVVKLADV